MQLPYLPQPALEPLKAVRVCWHSVGSAVRVWGMHVYACVAGVVSLCVPVSMVVSVCGAELAPARVSVEGGCLCLCVMCVE